MFFALIRISLFKTSYSPKMLYGLHVLIKQLCEKFLLEVLKKRRIDLHLLVL